MTLPTLEVFRQIEPPRRCSYIPGETAALEYRALRQIDVAEYERWLSCGWRRHGCYFFRPACPACAKCRPLRVDVAEFRPTKSQRRTLKRNADVEFVVDEAGVTDEHIRLYNAWHEDMHVRSGWRNQPTDANDYYRSFLLGEWPFAAEFRYYRDRRLVGVGLVDLLPDSLSSVYFFHDPAWRPLAPGTYSILQEIEYAQRTGRRWLYLGYWIAECQSMAYKSHFNPYELLTGYPSEDEAPCWSRPDR